MILDILKSVLKDTVMITSFVMVIMLFIEVLNIATEGSWSKHLVKSPLRQVLLGAVLGLIPGCFGGFAAVSMFTHGILNFGALMAAMIANTGDEAFVMLVQMPKETLWLMLILFVLSVLVGLICNRLVKKKSGLVQDKGHFVIHGHTEESLREMSSHWKEHLKKMTFSRALLLFGILMFMLMLVLGFFEHASDVHSAAGNSPHLHLPFDESWFNYVFMVLALLVLITIVCVNDHFIEHHLWGHVIKKHFLKIFLWTFAALLLIQGIDLWVEATAWINKNPMLILLIAVLIGLIPESGPHLVFIGLFVSGNIPFAVLLANSIVQDGHSSLPLFAESKKTFLWIKLSKAALGFLLGLVIMLI